MSSWILAIDTSTEACSCALGNGEQSYHRYTDIPRKHAEKVLPMVDELLAEAQINKTQLAAIAFGRGPGAFTGLRIAASIVQGLAFALDLPVIPVSSLQALAQRGYREFQYQQVLAAIDARMGEIYWGAFQLSNHNMMVLKDQEQLSAPCDLPVSVIDNADSWCGVGTGWQYQADMLAPLNALQQVQANVYTHALDILTIALPRFVARAFVSPEKALPVYLRNNVVQR